MVCDDIKFERAFYYSLFFDKKTVFMHSKTLLTQLPLIDGVSASKIYLPKNNAMINKTIFEYLCQQFTHITPEQWRQRFLDNLIFIKTSDGFLMIGINELYQTVQESHLYYYRSLDAEVVVPFEHEIIFENDRFMVVDKPHFLTMTPSGNYVSQTLLTRLKNQTKNAELTPIHRLDKETAGLVLFCKDKHYRGQYQSLFAKGCIKKVYHAIAPFNPTLDFPLSLSLRLDRGEPFYTMKVIEGEANSHTWINIIAVDKCRQWALYELYPTTGKLHQLRVHLNYLGLAIKNDPFYPRVCHKAENDFNNPLQLLAKRLRFTDPVDGTLYDFVSPKQLILT